MNKHNNHNQIPDAILCPICIEVPQNEIFQCKNGHCVCQSCCRNLTLCPECRVPYSQGKSRNRVLEELLHLVELDCPNKETGCGRKIKLKDVPNHAENCSKNKIVSSSVENNNGVGSKSTQGNIRLCKLLGHPKCEFLLNSATKYHQLWTHFNNKHEIAVKSGRAFTMNLVNFGNSGDKDSLWTPVLFNLQDTEGPSFLICAISVKGAGANQNYFLVFNIFLGGGGNPNQFELELSVRKRGNGEKYKWKVPTLSRADPMLEEILKARPNRQSVDFLKQFYMGSENFLRLEAEIVPVLGDALSHFIGGIKSGSETEAIWSFDTNVDTKPEIRTNNNGNTAPQPQPQPSTSSSSSTNNNMMEVGALVASFVAHLETLRPTTSPAAPARNVQAPGAFINIPVRYCDLCNQSKRVIPFFKCLQCDDYKVCKTCYRHDIHEEHVFARMENSDLDEDTSVPHTIIPYNYPRKMPNICKGDNLPKCDHPCHQAANNAPFARYVCISCDPSTEISQFCENCWRRGGLDQYHLGHDDHLIAVTDTDKRAEFIAFQFHKRFFPLEDA